MALRKANPALKARELTHHAMHVGHDHIAATANTLVLAYAGGAPPVLLIFSIGLIAAVPITTALAALVATRLSPAALAVDDDHVHGFPHRKYGTSGRRIGCCQGQFELGGWGCPASARGSLTSE